MDWKSYEDGKLGIPPGPNTDMDSYMAGKQGREMKTEVPGVAFTILIMAPFLFLVYPVLGVALLAICLALLAAVAWAPIPMALIKKGAEVTVHYSDQDGKKVVYLMKHV